MSTPQRAKPRLIHVTTTDMSLDWLLLPQLEAFAAAGYEVIGMSAPGPHVGALESAGIRHVAVASLTRSISIRRDVAAVRELTAAFRSLRPDIVHTHNPKPGVFGRIAARRAGVPVVVNTVHGLYATSDDRWAKRAAVYGIERIAASCSHAELLQNPEDLPVLKQLGVAESKLTVLGNGVDLQRFDPETTSVDHRCRLRMEFGVDDDTVVIGAVGRLVWEKGYAELFSAMSRLRSENHCLVVVGPDDPAKPGAVGLEARRAAAEAGVVFLGSRTDMVELYSAFDLYVLASHREGYPRSAMEAAAMGLPIVATDVRGCRQVVDHGETGLLVAPGDAGELAVAIDELVTDAGRRAEMGQAAIARARREFDDRQVIAKTLRVYDELLPARVAGLAATSR